MIITDQEFEYQVIKNILTNNLFFSKAFNLLKEKHFEIDETKFLLSQLKSYYKEYEKKPDFKSLIIYLKNKNLPDNLDLKGTLKTIKDLDFIDNEVLLKETEKWIKKQEMTDAILDSAELIEKNKVDEFEKIVSKIEEALKISMDSDLGLNYIDSLKDRYEYYTKKVFGFSTGIPQLDKILGGGFQPKRLHLFLGAQHTGKSRTLQYLAGNYISKGYDVLYVTLEMPEYEIAKGVDAYLLDTPANELRNLSKEEFYNKFPKNLGKLVIKEYPAGSFNTINLEALLQDLSLKENFNPQIIIIDYLGIMASSRISLGKAGSYLFYKSIAEELHGFSKKWDKVVISAVQFNRSAINATDIDEAAISDSIGIAQTADTMIAILNNEKLREENKVIYKFLKNRQTGYLYKLMLNVDYSKCMYWCDDEQIETEKSVIKKNDNALYIGKKEASEKKIDIKSLKIEDAPEDEEDLFNSL